MKHIILTLALALASTLTAGAQNFIKFGYANCDSLLRLMPEYATAQSQLATLRARYKAETDYNERTFKREFAEYLQGQKDFTESILLKRQRDLQYSLQKNLAFRQQTDSLLCEAEQQMLAPVRRHLNEILRAVGVEHGYGYILDTSRGAYPYIHPQVGEDCTPYVRQKIEQ